MASKWRQIARDMAAQEAYGPIYSAQYSDAQASARSNELARQLGLPADIVEESMPDMLAESRLRKAQAAAQASPSYAQMMSDPRFAKAAIDDESIHPLADAVQTLSADAERGETASRIWRESGVLGLGKNFLKAAGATTARGLAGFGRRAAENPITTALPFLDPLFDIPTHFGGERIKLPGAERAAAPYAQAAEYFGKVRDRSQTDWGNYYGNLVARGLENIPASVAAAGLGIATKNPSIPAAFFGAQAGGESYQRGREEGLDEGQAAKLALGHAVPEFFFERFPMAGLLKDLASGTGLGKTILKQMFLENVGEQLTTITQDFADWAYIDKNRGKTFGDYVSERPRAAFETLVQTTAAVGGQTVAARGLSAVGKRVGKRLSERESDDTAARNIGSVMSHAATSATRTANPSDFQAALERQLEGAPGETMYIPPEQVRTLFQGNPEAIDSDPFWGQHADQVREAEAMGGDVAIPTAEAVTHLAGTPQWEQLRDHVRVRPGGSSRAEIAETETKTKEATEAAAKAFEDTVNEINESEATPEQKQQKTRDALVEAHRNLMIQLGYKPRVAQTYGELMGARYATRAERRGEELTGREGETLEVRRGETAGRVEGVEVAPAAAPVTPEAATERALASYATEHNLGVNEVRQQYADNQFVRNEVDRRAEEFKAGPVPAAERGKLVYHGSPRADLTLEGIEIVRESGAKQGKKGRRYGGFYTVDEADISHAEGYAKMAEGTPTIYEVELKPDAVIEEHPTEISRISEKEINEYLARGVDAIHGKDVRGRTETVILNKDAIASFKVRPSTAADIERQIAEVERLHNGGLISNDTYVDQIRELVRQRQELAKAGPVPTEGVEGTTEGATGERQQGPAGQPAGGYTGERGGVPVVGGEAGPAGTGAVAGGRVEPRTLDRPPVNPDGTVTLDHWSLEPGLTQTDPTKWGRSGIFLPREERGRIGEAPPRTYFGIAFERGGYVGEFRRTTDPQTGEPIYEHPTKKEPVERVTTNIPIERLYDMGADPDGLRAKAKDIPRNQFGEYQYEGRWIRSSSIYEQLIRDAGYAGYWVNDPQVGLVAAVYEPVQVVPHVEGRTMGQAAAPVTEPGRTFYQDAATALPTTEETAQPVIGEVSLRPLVNTLQSTTALARDSQFPTGRDFKVALQERAQAAQQGSNQDLGDYSDATADTMSDYAFNDAIVALRHNDQAIGWYDRKVREALKLLSLIYPELQTDSEGRFAFIWGLAVTSNGLKVNKNFELAANAYDHWKRNGSFPKNFGIGTAAEGIDAGLDKYEQLLARFDGDWRRARDFMIEQRTVREIEAISGIDVGGEFKDEVTRGAVILGAKIGNGFFSNLNGYFDELTMDRWLIRTVGRWRGTLLEHRPDMEAQKQGELRDIIDTLTAAQMREINDLIGERAAGLASAITRLSQQEGWFDDVKALGRSKALLAIRDLAPRPAHPEGLTTEQKRESNKEFGRARKAEVEAIIAGLTTAQRQQLEAQFLPEADTPQLARDMTPEQINALAVWITKKSQKPAWRDAINELFGGQQVRLVGNSLTGWIDGQVEMPRGPEDRRFLRKVFRDALVRIRASDPKFANLTMADLQAVLWYPEKLVYDTAKKPPGQEVTEYDDDEAPDYENAARTLVRDRLGQDALDRYDADAERSRREAVDQRAAGEAAAAASAEGRTLDQALIAAETAPDPNTRTGIIWNALPQEERDRASQEIANLLMPDIMKAVGVPDADIFVGLGGYLNTVNVSFGAGVDVDKALQLAAVLGEVFNQDAVMVENDEEFEKSEEYETIGVEGISEQQAREIAKQLWTLNPANPEFGTATVVGFTYRDGKLTVINNHNNPNLAADIDRVTGGVHKWGTGSTHTRFVGRDDYVGIIRNSEVEQGAIDQFANRAVAATATRMEAAAKARGMGAGQAAATEGGEGGAPGLEPPKSLEQATVTDPRGQITFGPINVVELFQGSDLSTFIHEMGHLFLEELREDATRPGASQQLKDDWAAVEKWFADNGSPIQPGQEIPTIAHELWARGWERFAMEGKAPSPTLRKAFDAFKRWMITIYKRVDALNSPISDEIRDVMQRLIATDEEIDLARQQQGTERVMTQEEAGMTDEAYADYRRTADDARDEAHDELLRRTMRTVRAQKTKEWRDEAAEVRAEIAAEVDQQPVFRALEAISKGGMRISRQWLLDNLGEEGMATLPQRVPPLHAENGMHPDDIAEQVGYSSGQEMIDELVGLQQQTDAMRARGDKRSLRVAQIEDAVRSEMLRRNGDILNDGTIEDEAADLIHNEKQGDVLSAELRSLGRGIGKRSTPYTIVREWAAAKIAGMTIAEAASGAAIQRYRRASTRAGAAYEEALIAGDKEEAYRQKQIQMFNNALIAEAKKAKDATDAAQTRLRKVAAKRTMPSIDQDYLDQAHALLEDVDIKPRSQRLVERKKSFEEWAAEQEAQGRDVPVPPSFAGMLGKKHWSQLTTEEMLGLDEAVQQIMHLGRLKQKLIDNGKERDHRAVVDEAIDQSQTLPDVAPKDVIDPTFTQRQKARIAGLDSSLLKIETMVDWLDGGNPNGVFNRMIFRPIAEAEGASNDRMRVMMKQLTDVLKRVPNKYTKRWEDRVTIELANPNGTMDPWKPTRQRLIAMALNMGNEGNAQRLADGYGWDQSEIMRVLNRELSAEEWTYVQDVWNTIETLWPDLSAMERRVNGIAPDKVPARKLDTSAGVLDGGYFPAVYDASLDYTSEQHAAMERAGVFPAGYARATTRSSATKERAARVSRPISLDIGIQTRHVAEVIHDITHREAVMNADKFLSDPRIMKLMDQKLGPEYRKQFRPWLQDVAGQHVEARTGNEGMLNILNGLRANTTIVGMGFRATTMLSQLAGFSNVLEVVPPKWFAIGLNKWKSNPVSATRFVREKSAEMRHRAENLDRDMNAVIAQAQRGGTGGIGSIKQAKQALTYGRQFAMHGIMYFDTIVTIPSWIGAYERALADGKSEEDAIYSADKTIRQTQGSMSQKDMAAVARGTGKTGAITKLFTMFYSYMSALYQRQRNLGRDIRGAFGKGAAGFADMPALMARSFWLLAVPSVLAEILSGRGPDDDEDWGIWALKTMLLGNLGSIPGIRDVAKPMASAISGEWGHDYQLSPIQSAGASLVRVGKDVGNIIEGEETTRATRNLMEAVGYTTGLIPGQAAASTQFLVDVASGEADPDGVKDWYTGLTKGRLPEEE